MDHIGILLRSVTNLVQFVGRFQTEATVKYDGKYWTVASTNENAWYHFGM